MGQPITHDDTKDIGERITKDSLIRGTFLALTIFIGVRFLFAMNTLL